MPVNLSIKEVPDALAERLRARAARNHRSLQRELMCIVEAAADESPVSVVIAQEPVAARYVVSRTPAVAQADAESDSLLDELDAVVAGSQWGHAGVLTRDQTHDRRLQRELDFDARRAEAAAQPARAV